MATNISYGPLSGLLGGAIGQGQLAQQQLASNTAYNYYPLPYTTSTLTTVTTGTSAASIDLQQYLAFDGEIEPRKSTPKKAQKTGRILLDLRREIDDWHGDILRAA